MIFIFYFCLSIFFSQSVYLPVCLSVRPSICLYDIKYQAVFHACFYWLFIQCNVPTTRLNVLLYALFSKLQGIAAVDPLFNPNLSSRPSGGEGRREVEKGLFFFLFSFPCVFPLPSPSLLLYYMYTLAIIIHSTLLLSLNCPLYRSY